MTKWTWRCCKRMLKRAFEYLPNLPGLSALRAWTGHRPATPDKLPLIGPTRENERIWLATGHEGLGITTSLGTGQLLADLILKRATAIPAAPYSPARLERLERLTMADDITIRINNQTRQVPRGTLLAVALAAAGETRFPPLGHRPGARTLVRHGHLL